MPSNLPAAEAEERGQKTLVTGVEVSDPVSLMRIELALHHIEDMKRFDRRIDDVP